MLPIEEEISDVPLCKLGRRLTGAFMTDEQQLAGAFWEMNRAVLKINEILTRNPALAENLPITPPRILDSDEIAGETRILAAYFEGLAR